MSVFAGAGGVVLTGEGSEEAFNALSGGFSESGALGQGGSVLIEDDLVDGYVIVGHILQLLSQHAGSRVGTGGEFRETTGQILRLQREAVELVGAQGQAGECTARTVGGELLDVVHSLGAVGAPAIEAVLNVGNVLAHIVAAVLVRFAARETGDFKAQSVDFAQHPVNHFIHGRQHSGIDPQGERMIAFGKIEGFRGAVLHDGHVREGSGIVHVNHPGSFRGDGSIQKQIEEHREICLHALTVVEIQIVPSGVFHGECVCHGIAGGIEGSAVEMVEDTVLNAVGGQHRVEFTGTANGGLAAAGDVFALNDDHAAALGLFPGVCRQGVRALQGHRADVGAAVLAFQRQRVVACFEFKQERLVDPGCGVRETNRLFLLGRNRCRRNLVAVAVDRNLFGFNDPDGIELHATQLVEGQRVIHTHNQFRGQGGLGGVQVSQPDFILSILRNTEIHFSAVSDFQCQVGFKGYRVLSIDGQGISCHRLRIEWLGTAHPDVIFRKSLPCGTAYQQHQYCQQSQSSAHQTHLPLYIRFFVYVFCLG